MGCPIRISTDQSLLAAPHGFSQRATSFVASWCQGIHRMPLSRSRPPHTHRNHPHPIQDTDENQARPAIPNTLCLLSTLLSASPRSSGQTPNHGHEQKRTNLFTLTKNIALHRPHPAGCRPISRLSHDNHPPPQHASTPTGGGGRNRTDDPLLAKQVLCQLSYAPVGGARWWAPLVGQGGLEPPTPRLSSVCSNQLSY